MQKRAKKMNVQIDKQEKGKMTQETTDARNTVHSTVFQFSGQSYKHFTIVINDPRVVIWAIS